MTRIYYQLLCTQKNSQEFISDALSIIYLSLEKIDHEMTQAWSYDT